MELFPHHGKPSCLLDNREKVPYRAPTFFFFEDAISGLKCIPKLLILVIIRRKDEG
jgi:hypothetical protein